jgi:hypothetical protein
MLIAPIPTAGLTPVNHWSAPHLSAKHAASSGAVRAWFGTRPQRFERYHLPTPALSTPTGQRLLRDL